MKDFTLVKWTLDFVSDTAAAANNPKIAERLRNGFHNPYTAEDAEEFIKSCIENEGKGQLCRAIFADGKAVGSIGVFCRDDVYCKSAELGYWLSEDYWGQGIMTEAVKQICAEAFERFDIFRISAEPYAANSGSCRVLEKAGFIREGTLKKSVFKNGKLYDSFIYAMVK